MAIPTQNLSTEQLQSLDNDHHLHPFTDSKNLHAIGSRVIERAEGIYIWDTDGNKIIDGMAGLWCVNIGYGRTELIEAGIKQMETLPYYNTFFNTAHRPVIELSRMLATVTAPHLNHVFLTNSGSEANDTIIRLVRYYWALKGKPKKSVIISRHNAYHGSTIGAASLSGMDTMHAQGGLPIPEIEHIGQPYWYQEGLHTSPEEFGSVAALELEEKIKQLRERNVAAFIAEPIQGAGGVVIPPETYWPEIQRICSEYEILLIADEVITGFGRTGKWFGSDYYQIKPDLMTIAKGLSSGYLPIAGVMVSDEVASVLIEDGGEFAHGFTYSGHPVACAVAAENLRILQEEKIIDTVANESGPYLEKKWKAIEDHPLVGEARSVGLIAALELVEDKVARTRFDSELNAGIKCRDNAISNGLMMRAIGDTMVLAPPLIITKSQIDDLADIVVATLDQTHRELNP